jgi:hypothetical protein
MKAWAVAIILTVSLFGAQRQGLRGWISDEGCARGRASGGVYTGTNPQCAKDCIAKGAKAVLIVPDQKMIYVVSNPDAVRAQIGNYVEITGAVDPETASVRVDSLKMITEGRAQCDVPSKSK